MRKGGTHTNEYGYTKVFALVRKKKSFFFFESHREISFSDAKKSKVNKKKERVGRFSPTEESEILISYRRKYTFFLKGENFCLNPL